MSDNQLRLERTGHIYKDGRAYQLMGRLYLPDGGSLATLEQPWRGNRNRISCIPPAPGERATYAIRKRSPKYSRLSYWHLLVEDVPGRKYILFHRANYVVELAGCIAVGTRYRVLRGSHADLFDSKAAMDHLMTTYNKYQPEKLAVTWQGRANPRPLKEQKSPLNVFPEPKQQDGMA